MASNEGAAQDACGAAATIGVISRSILRIVRRVCFRWQWKESDPQVGNNATAIWKGLFGVFLSGTAAPFLQRLPALVKLHGGALARGGVSLLAFRYGLASALGNARRNTTWKRQTCGSWPVATNGLDANR